MIKVIFLMLMLNILKTYKNFRKSEIEKFEKLMANLHDKTEMLYP